jgi:hypothetical protein
LLYTHFICGEGTSSNKKYQSFRSLHRSYFVKRCPAVGCWRLGVCSVNQKELYNLNMAQRCRKHERREPVAISCWEVVDSGV